jgi:autotransporter-associated beta strand protein
VISGTGTFTKSGTGTLTLSGTDTYTGATTVSAGTLSLGDGAATGNIIPSTNLITDNSILIYNTPSTIAHSGVISGTGTFTKSGSGTLTLSGANTYTGATTVSAGELQFNGVNTGTSAKTVSGGMLSGTGTIPGTVTVANAAGSTLRGGTGSGTSGTLTVNGILTFSGPLSSLNVTSNGAGLSRVSVGTNTITESFGMTVNLLDSMPAGTYTLISKTNAGLPTTLPTLGTNNSGKTAVFAWTSGTGLTVTLTIPPAPTFVSATTNTAGTAINITFNKAMASPAGDQSQFTYSINGGAAQAFSAAALNTNTAIIDLTTSGTTIAYGETITVNYTKGTVTSADGGVLATFANYAVTNNVPEPSVAIALNQSSIFLPLAAGSTATNTSLGITVSANTRFTITVADSTGRPANLGYMGSYTSGIYDTAGPRLASALGLAGTTNGTTTAQTIIPPITTGSTLYSGSAAVTNQLLAPNTYSQPVAVTDLHLPTGSTYRIDLVFTITPA